MNSLDDDHTLDHRVGVIHSEDALRRQKSLQINDTRLILDLCQHGELGQHSHRKLELSCKPLQIVFEGLLEVVSRR